MAIEPNPRDYEPAFPPAESRRWRAIIWGMATAGIVLMVAAMCTAKEAQAHSWYTGKKDPVTEVSCCGGTDCDEIAATDVEEVSGGYVYKPTGEFIPMSRVQFSHDWQFHRCEFLYDSYAQRGEGFRKGQTRCFFAPPGSS